MKNLTFPLILTVLLASAAFAQSVTITGVKKVYTRPKASSKYKKTFSIRRPVVKANTSALSQKITAAIDPVNILEIDLKDELSGSEWLSEADFETVCNDNGVLTVKEWMEGAGAYPDGVTKFVVINTETAERLTPDNAFQNKTGLIAFLKGKQDAEVQKAIKEIKANPDFGDGDPKELFEYTGFEDKDLAEFSVDADGITFYYDYGFPHVIQALQPDGEYKLTWAEAKAFIKQDGLLAWFVR
jgi:hypothetical protein